MENPLRCGTFAALLFQLFWVLSGWGCSTDAPETAENMQFVPGASCIKCHEDQAELWQSSHHAKAMAVADAQTVLADFDSTFFDYNGFRSWFYRADNKYFVSTDSDDGARRAYEIKYTFGVVPLQQYLVETERGRMQALQIAWDTENKRWFHLYPDEKIDHKDQLHWTGRYFNWNFMCAECHSTNLERNYDFATDSYATTWNDINVGCQACHGPGARHVREAEAEIWSDSSKGLVVTAELENPKMLVESCAPCHSRRHAVSADDRHQLPLLDHYQPELLYEGLYHPDGQIQDEVYVYGSFVQSKMYEAGVGCSDCHNVHSLKLLVDGNGLCTRCHNAGGNPTYPTLMAKKYDTPKHHFHEEKSEGALCVNCHMASKNYMVVDPRRDHSFQIPSVDLTAKLDVPNACNQCHQDKKTDWAAAAFEKWYGKPDDVSKTAAGIIAAGREGKPDIVPDLIQLLDDSTKSIILRATALHLIQGFGPQLTGVSIAHAKSEHALLRLTALKGLAAVRPAERFTFLAPLLKDSLRAVRIEAARLSAAVPDSILTIVQKQELEAAQREYRDVLAAEFDQPGAHLNMANFHTDRGELQEAEDALQNAIKLDNRFVPAFNNLAMLYDQIGKKEHAANTLSEAMLHNPEEGQLHYSMGLLLAEQKKLVESIVHFQKASELMPDRARIFYNLSLALQHTGQMKEGEVALLKAHDLDKSEPGTLRALVIFYARQKDSANVEKYGDILRSVFKGDQRVDQFIQSVRSQMRR